MISWRIARIVRRRLNRPVPFLHDRASCSAPGVFRRCADASTNDSRGLQAANRDVCLGDRKLGPDLRNESKADTALMSALAGKLPLVISLPIVRISVLTSKGPAAIRRR